MAEREGYGFGQKHRQWGRNGLVKYWLFPGWVEDKRGELKWCSAEMIMSAYNLKPENCAICLQGVLDIPDNIQCIYASLSVLRNSIIEESV